MVRRAAVLVSCTLSVLHVAFAQPDWDADNTAAQVAWAAGNYLAVIESTDRFLAKPGKAVDIGYADVRYLRAASWCRMEPTTPGSQARGQKQLAALVADLEMALDEALTVEVSSLAKTVLRKAKSEQAKCASVADPTLFGSLGIQPATAQIGSLGGRPVTGGKLITVREGNPRPGRPPGTTGVLRERESDFLLKTEVLDLQLQQLRTDQKVQLLQQRGVQGSGALAK